jgi:hypothetical protein
MRCDESKRNELMTPTMCVSFGGNLDELQALPGYDGCARLAMRTASSVRDGDEPHQHGQHRQGGLALGYAAETDRIEL